MRENSLFVTAKAIAVINSFRRLVIELLVVRSKFHNVYSKGSGLSYFSDSFALHSAWFTLIVRHYEADCIKKTSLKFPVDSGENEIPSADGARMEFSRHFRALLIKFFNYREIFFAPFRLITSPP